MLPASFIQCHKSYIINTHFLADYDRTTLQLSIKTYPVTHIPVGRAYKESLEKRIKEEG